MFDQSSCWYSGPHMTNSNDNLQYYPSKTPVFNVWLMKVMNPNQIVTLLITSAPIHHMYDMDVLVLFDICEVLTFFMFSSHKQYFELLHLLILFNLLIHRGYRESFTNKRICKWGRYNLCLMTVPIIPLCPAFVSTTLFCLLDSLFYPKIFSMTMIDTATNLW